jgi:hypothetical protein
MPVVRTAISVAAVVMALALAPPALANRSASSNWAGYAVHGATFQQVTARWRQPHAACVPGKTTYSAIWVGLGGYSLSSNELEQIGTELDCNATGHTVSSAWYELIPDPSHTIGLRVLPGDQIEATVASAGGAVTLTLSNLSRHHSFQRTFRPAAVDLSSAEWILEAPSACIAGTSFCRTLPLTNFRQAVFTYARVLPTTGQLGTISSGPWAHTRITLVPSGQQFVTNNHGGVPFGTARPSSLSPNGGSFSVTFRRVYVPAGSLLTPRQPRGRSYLQH